MQATEKILSDLLEKKKSQEGDLNRNRVDNIQNLSDSDKKVTQIEEGETNGNAIGLDLIKSTGP